MASALTCSYDDLFGRRRADDLNEILGASQRQVAFHAVTPAAGYGPDISNGRVPAGMGIGLGVGHDCENVLPRPVDLGASFEADQRGHR
jgi:hypothetical protein